MLEPDEVTAMLRLKKLGQRLGRLVPEMKPIGTTPSSGPLFRTGRFFSVLEPLLQFDDGDGPNRS
ncbi:hypothetical protein N183_36620 [Sinorhizobium sp. Sb3]|nr:hypothetical protein N183_36620 [Sinorhizobium sp. Sb3]